MKMRIVQMMMRKQQPCSLKECWEQLLQLPLTTLQQLHKRSFRLKSNLAQLFFDALQLKRSKVEHYEQHIFYHKLALRKLDVDEW